MQEDDPALREIRFKITEEIRKNIERTIREEIGRQVNRQMRPLLENGALDQHVRQYVEEAAKGQVGAIFGLNGKGRVNEEAFKNLVKALVKDDTFGANVRTFILQTMNSLIEERWKNAYTHGLSQKIRKTVREIWRDAMVKEIQET